MESDHPAPHSLRLPLAVCRDLALVGGAALSLRLALLVIARAVALPPVESAPEVVYDEDEDNETDLEGSDDGDDGEAIAAPTPTVTKPTPENGGRIVRVRLTDIAAVTGSTRANVLRACDVLLGMRASWTDADGQRVTTPLIEAAGWGGGRAARGEASLYLEVNGVLAEHLGTRADVDVPVDVLRGLTKRAAVLMLIRGLAAIHERTDDRPVRASVDAADLPHYTGLVDDGGSPWAQVRDYLVVGAHALTDAGSPIVVRVLVNGRCVYAPRPAVPETGGDAEWTPDDWMAESHQDAKPSRRRALALRDVTLVWDHRRQTRVRRPKSLTPVAQASEGSTGDLRTASA